VVANKSDVGKSSEGVLPVSATMQIGLDALRAELARALDVDPQRGQPSITNLRHLTLMKRAHEMLTRARQSLVESGGSLSEEFLLADLQVARHALEEISGQRASEDVLAHIFSRFCVGK